jgi:hypothetical protein
MIGTVRPGARLGALVAGVVALAMPIGGASALSAPAAAAAPRSGTLEATSGDPDQVGAWKVVAHGGGAYTVSWTSPRSLPVTDDRPMFTRAGEDVAVPTLGADGRTLSVDVAVPEGSPAPDTDALDVELSGQVLDSAAEEPVQAAVIPPLPDTTSLTPDPGQPGSHPITASTYQLPGVKMPGMPGKIEMLGHVVRPTDATAGAPIVLFLHGRHESCYESPNPTGSGRQEWPCPKGTSPVPSYLGYVYVQELLASQGYVTVSISANGINAQDWRLIDGGAAARGRLIARHLQDWGDPTYATAIGPAVTADLDDVVLVGHSRGGEGANRASAMTPLNAPYRIAGQVLIGPTDFGRQSAPYIPTVTMLPYCDGDVADLQGQTFTDLARDFAPGDTALHSSLLVMGANHNFFNTEWTPGLSEAPSFDDWFDDPDKPCGRNSDSRLSKAEQRAVGKSYIAGAVRLMADGEDAMLPLFDGSRVSLASAGDTDVRSHAVGLDRSVRAPGHGAGLAPGGSATTQLCIGRSDRANRAQWCGRRTESFRTPHWPGTYPPGAPAKRAFEMSWDQAGQDGGLTFAQPLDLTGRTLHLRTIVDPATPTAQLTVRLQDVNGDTAEVDAEDLPSLPRGSFVLGKRWAQDLAVDSADFGPGLDLTQITGVTLVARNDHGRVWVLDVEAGDASLAPVPDARAGRLRLGNLTIDEGDTEGTVVAHVPFRIDGNVSQPTTFHVAPAGFFGGRSPIAVVHVPAGTHTGTIDVPYQSNRLDDLPLIRYDLAAYGLSGAMPTDYIGRLKILDDDPTPSVTVTPRRGTIREGWVARFDVRLSKPLNYYDAVIAQIVAGPERTPGLRANDVSRAWLKDHLGEDIDPGSRRLDRLPLRLGLDLRPGQTHVAFSIPLRHDVVRERLEHLSLRAALSASGHGGRATVRVQDVAPHH